MGNLGIKPCLIRPKLIQNESLASYVHRLTYSNYYDSTSALIPITIARAATINNNVMDEEALEIISDLSLQDKEILRPMSSKQFEQNWGGELVKKVIMMEKVKYCPRCIHEQLHHKLIWVLRPVSICLAHNVYLVDQCHQCRCAINMRAFMSGNCDRCHSPYAQAPFDKASLNSIVYRSQVDIQRRFNEKRLSLQDDLTLAVHSFHLLEGLMSFVDDTDEPISAFFTNRNGFSSRQAGLAYANYYWMYQDFPRNFRHVLDVFNAKNSTSKSEQRKKFERVFNGQRYPVIWSAYKAYWVDRVDLGKAQKSVSLFLEEEDMLDARKYITQEEAMKEFGFSTDQISKLIRSNQLRCQINTRGKTKDVLIERTSIEEIIHEQQFFINQVAVQTILGVSRDSIYKMIDAGLLDRKGSLTNKWLFDSRHVEDVLIRLRGKYIESEVEGISYNDAAKRYRVDGFTLVDLLILIKENRVNAYTNTIEGTLLDSVVDEEHLTQYIASLRRKKQIDQGYTLNEVTKLLRVSYHTLLKMSEQELLVPERVITKRDGTKEYWYNKNKIDTFLAEHCTIAQAESEFNVSRKRISTWIKNGQLKDRSLGLCHRILIERSELEQLLAKKELLVNA